jgi:hypothetical protein
MALEIYLIIALVLLQVVVFFKVYFKIKAYQQFFPTSFKSIEIKKFTFGKAVISDSETFNSFLESLSKNKDQFDDFDESDAVELLVTPIETKDNHSDFYQVIKSTNAYLCKNKGASADFSILKDTCERHLEKVDNEIGNLINVPLYIGLAGTFIGIIIGLWGIDISSLTSGSTTVITSESVDKLLKGVIAAMFASLAGLTFTIINSALVYKPAAYKNDSDKNQYYDFLQRELLPYLNIGVSKSLGSFKDVLNQFIRKFGENMDDYKDSGNLLNENLQKQQLVLEEINRLSLTRTAAKIAELFSTLNDSSQHLEKFNAYQIGLNNYVDKTEQVAHEMNVVVDNFKDFNNNLKVISDYSVTSIEVQRQLKDSLEKHFPTIDDHRKIWRLQVDELNQDIKEVYRDLNNYFKVSTDQIQTFISSNNNFFTGINEIQNGIKIFVENSAIQKDEFIVLKDQIVDLRNDFRDSQSQSIETNKAIIDALIELNKTLSKVLISTDK